jgi:hypothetical protein
VTFLLSKPSWAPTRSSRGGRNSSPRTRVPPSSYNSVVAPGRAHSGMLSDTLGIRRRRCGGISSHRRWSRAPRD